MKLLLIGIFALSFNTFASEQCLFGNENFYTVTRSISLTEDSLDDISGTDVLWAERFIT
jgi:hypothetical protein